MLSAEDRNHLDLLGIFHYVVAGMAGLFSLIPVFHLVFGLLMASGRLDGSDDPGARVVGTIFVVFAATMIAVGLTYAVATVLAGRALRRLRSYTFCLVMAGVECLFMPFGTVLGVLTLVKLVQPEVKAAFGAASAPSSEPAVDAGEGAGR